MSKRVVVIEDDPNKRRRLAEFVQAEVRGADLVEKFSYQSGLEFLLRERADVVLLDMSMPTYDITDTERGNEIRPFAGRELLRELKRKEVSTKVIIVTQFETFGEGGEAKTLDEVRNEIRKAFRNNFVAAVFYSAADASWQEKLRVALRSI